MLQLSPRCKVCKAVKRNEKLLKRIYDSKYYNKTSGDTLLKIHEDNKDKFSYQSLTVHVKKHQGITKEDLNKSRMTQIAKEQENKAIRRAVTHTEVRQEIMDIGMEGIREGNIKLKAQDVLRAAEGEATIEEKHKDRQASLMKMIWGFASGEMDDSGLDSPETRDYIDVTS